jgi:hypothetical protein
LLRRPHLSSLPQLPPPGPRLPLGRRPGERREPLHIDDIPDAFVAATAALGLSVACALEIALELELVRRDLAALGRKRGLEGLLRQAESERISGAVAAPLAPYLRQLWRTRPRSLDPLELEEPIDVPLRFFPRVLSVATTGALVPERLGQALILERAAVSAGRTMTEYALLHAAAL